MSKPNKLSNRTKRKIRAELTAERHCQEERNRHAKMGSQPLYTMQEEKADHWAEVLLGSIVVVLGSVLYGLATLIFGA